MEECAIKPGNPSVLPNRKAFSDYITRLFIKANLRAKDQDTQDADMCTRQTASTTRELMPYQKLVRDYLMIETPYRGLLIYHGLGSGKTCSAIGVAESMLSHKKVYVLLPASLQSNFRQQLRECGDALYTTANHWDVRLIKSDADKQEGRRMGLSEAFLQEGRYWTTQDKPANFESLKQSDRDSINAQIDDLIDQRYTFINYNGLTSASVKILIPDDINPFNNSVVIIDEAHNFISRVVNESDIARRVYDAIYKAAECKVVMLSGTPVVNKPNEVAFFMNLLRGPIEKLALHVNVKIWDEMALKKFFTQRLEVDSVDFGSLKRIVFVTRNPPHFKSLYNKDDARIAVAYDSAFEFHEYTQWAESLKNSFRAFGEIQKVERTFEECLPTGFAEFTNMFIDGLSVKNPLLFQKRIQGLVSYYKGADERMLPKVIESQNSLELVPMSDDQFIKYLGVRYKEIQLETRKARNTTLNEDFTSAKVLSRLVCNYAVPEELKEPAPESENDVLDKSEILAKLVALPEKYLRPDGLSVYSPKLKRALTNLKKTSETRGNQFVYSQYRELEGLGIFAEILRANGFQEYTLKLENGVYQEGPLDDTPAFAFYSGKEKPEVREICRLVFNEDWTGLQRTFPSHYPSLRDSVAKRNNKKILCVLLGTSSAAEGLNLKNVRHIHILEPYWNPARHDQVVGRGVRLCSHASKQLITEGGIETVIVPQEERTIRVSFYVSVFSASQNTTTEAPNVVPVRRADTRDKLYDTLPSQEFARAPEAFLTSDEFLYEVSYEKSRITAGISLLLKQAAVDCEIHRKLHSKEQPVIQCMRFDASQTTESLAYAPNIADDEKDAAFLRNQITRKRTLQRVLLNDEFLVLFDPNTNQVFDNVAFQDANRLIQIGVKREQAIEFFVVAT